MNTTGKKPLRNGYLDANYELARMCKALQD
jgi:hypothetical protein